MQTGGAGRGRVSRRLTAQRRWVVPLHRWLSIFLVGFLVLESITGTLLVFEAEIDRWWNRDEFAPTAGDVGSSAAAEAAAGARPDDRVSLVTVPSADVGGMYWVELDDASGRTHVVLVDPGTGVVVDANHTRPALVALASRWHITLNSTSVFGLDPLDLMGVLALLWIATLLAGLYLWWWPGVRRWARALRVRRTRGPFTFHLDLHKAVGIVMVVPLVLVVVTSLRFTLPEPLRSVWEVATLGAYEQASTDVSVSSPRAGVVPIGSDAAIDAVRAIDPAVRVTSVIGPGGSPVGVYQVFASVDRTRLTTAGGERSVRFDVDQYSGSILAIRDPADRSVVTTAFDEWAYTLHYGRFAGMATRIAWIAVGLAPLVLTVSGLRMWWLRRTKRRGRPPGIARIEPPATERLLEPT